jgi:hypothetical protein
LIISENDRGLVRKDRAKLGPSPLGNKVWQAEVSAKLGTFFWRRRSLRAKTWRRDYREDRTKIGRGSNAKRSGQEKKNATFEEDEGEVSRSEEKKFVVKDEEF